MQQWYNNESFSIILKCNAFDALFNLGFWPLLYCFTQTAGHVDTHLVMKAWVD